MIRGFARSAFGPLLSEAMSSLRGAADAAEDRAMRGTVRMASVLAIAIGAALAGVLAMTFLALAIRRGLAAAYDPVAADIALAIGFIVLALVLVFVLRAMTRPRATMRRQTFRYDDYRSSFAPRSGRRTTSRPGARGASPGPDRSSRPDRSEPDDRQTTHDDHAADPNTPDEGSAGPPAVAVAGVMVAAVVAGLLLGRRS